MMMMKRRRIFCYFVMAILQISTWFWWCCFAARPGQIPQFHQAPFQPNQGMGDEKEETYRGLSRLGSRPPNCEHKCKGCNPCKAIEMPATASHKRLQYANYEPEGWKCKCGATFFNP